MIKEIKVSSKKMNLKDCTSGKKLIFLKKLKTRGMYQ